MFIKLVNQAINGIHVASRSDGMRRTRTMCDTES